MRLSEFPLAPESPVELSANGVKIAVLMCTPLNLDDLAVGHLFTRGMLKDPDSILTVGACADLRVASVVAPGAVVEDRFGLGTVVASGCGSGSALADPSALGTVPPGYCVDILTLKAWSREMFSRADLYRKTGGMHCAALALDEAAEEPKGRNALAFSENAPAGSRYFVVREDVGRHNAVDKILGRAFMDKVDFSRTCILTSGRIAADMILKAISAKIPVVVSRSIPTTTAFEIASAAGLTIVGRIGESEPYIYCAPDRIRS